jgi:YHS domain-containing protein
MKPYSSSSLSDTRDKDNNEIFWGECIFCGMRTHHKVKDVTYRKMKAGETYYFSHEHCSHLWKVAEEKKKE